MADSNRLHSINTSRILRTIWLNPSISRIKVAEMLDLDRSTVTKIMQVIMDRGLVVTTGKNTEQSGVGRRQINLEINQDIGVVVGIELQDSRHSVVVTTIAGDVIHSFEGVSHGRRDGLGGIILSIVDEARRFIDASGLFLLGVGVGIPGIVDPYTGTVIRSNPFKILEPACLREEVELGCDVPVFIENDANCCCWAEIAFQREGRERNFISVLGEFRDLHRGTDKGTGLAIGLGLVVRNRVLHGDHFTAGEFRSVLAGKAPRQFKIPYEELSTLPENRPLLRRVYRELTENLAFLVNCVDFTKIVFAGDLAQYPENLKECMEQAIVGNWIYDLDRTFVIEFSKYGKQSVSIGAAGLFVEKLFAVPDIADRFQEVVGYDLYEQILGRKGR